MDSISVIERLTQDVQSANRTQQPDGTIDPRVYILAKYWTARTTKFIPRYQKQDMPSVLKMFEKERKKLKDCMVERKWAQWWQDRGAPLSGQGKVNGDKRNKLSIQSMHAKDVSRVRAVFGSRLALILAQASISGIYRCQYGPEHVIFCLIEYLNSGQEGSGIDVDMDPAMEPVLEPSPSTSGHEVEEHIAESSNDRRPSDEALPNTAKQFGGGMDQLTGNDISLGPTGHGGNQPLVLRRNPEPGEVMVIERCNLQRAVAYLHLTENVVPAYETEDWNTFTSMDSLGKSIPSLCPPPAHSTTSLTIDLPKHLGCPEDERYLGISWIPDAFVTRCWRYSYQSST